MRNLTTTSALILALPMAAMAQSEAPNLGRELAELIYGSIEDNPEGAADMGEFVNFGRDIFVSMDHNESGSVDFSEFTDWDLDSTSSQKMRVSNAPTRPHKKSSLRSGIVMQTAQSAGVSITLRWSPTSGALTPTMMLFLTREEFLSGYLVNLAYRAAITGQ